MRTAPCRVCGIPVTTDAKRGPIPHRCDDCYRAWRTSRTPEWRRAMEARGRERAGDADMLALDPETCAAIVDSPRWNVQADPDGSCIIWAGHRNDRGYGTLGYRIAAGLSRPRYAHRIALVAHLGRDLQPGMVVDHICRTPACVNPEHLEEVTQRVNVDRGMARRRSHCVNGHPFDETNTYIRPDKGTQQCKACGRARKARAA